MLHSLVGMLKKTDKITKEKVSSEGLPLSH